MTFSKWSEVVEGSGYAMDYPLCSIIYKEQYESIVTFLVTEPNDNKNLFTWYR